jgi:hypothetical protein
MTLGGHTCVDVSLTNVWHCRKGALCCASLCCVVCAVVGLWCVVRPRSLLTAQALLRAQGERSLDADLARGERTVGDRAANGGGVFVPLLPRAATASPPAAACSRVVVATRCHTALREGRVVEFVVCSVRRLELAAESHSTLTSPRVATSFSACS